MIKEEYGVIVVGGGHAGIEASLASARMGVPTLLLTLNIDTIGQMSCNPSIGGTAKGHLVREIDALGGEMGKASDQTGIQFRILNDSRGPAVKASRAQIDKYQYRDYMRRVVFSQSNLVVKQGSVKRLLVEGRKVVGIETIFGERIYAKAVVITPGTFMRGILFVGKATTPGGRMGENPVSELSEQFISLGFNVGRFKTGTPPRLDGKTIDFSVMEVQKTDYNFKPFSIWTDRRRFPIQPQREVYITYTNETTHNIILSNLHTSPLYSGMIKGTGVRYCPSIEDKIVKFSQRDRHHVFIEPESLMFDEWYPNGISTSLSYETQLSFVRSIRGLENVRITRYGYAVEHDYVDPTQLYPTLETKLVENLFLAGQINGTTGYEEAASQGIVAGINSALKVMGKSPIVLSRTESYIGVLIDDLTTKGTNEPYRMFTSRAEYRLLLREDNAVFRLSRIGYQVGLLPRFMWENIEYKYNMIRSVLHVLSTEHITPSKENNQKLVELGLQPITKPTTLEEMLLKNGFKWEYLYEFSDNVPYNLPDDIIEYIQIEVKYKGYIQREIRSVRKLSKLENVRIPEDFDYSKVKSLSREVIEKLSKFRPYNLYQASRISGITPAAVIAIMNYLDKHYYKESIKS
ncbi:MAG: tRNA uridine-5-carboxymethylaminomethyl(34) synthesis enzyme MnmG [Brevinematales bacterium]|nr:tRNA uridine-5-carboxymethylaminomethyl(34) synthesis enzyme MnmG [Brevinematales bacterium]